MRAPASPPTAVRSPGVSHSAERQSCGRPESVPGAHNVLLRQWTPSRTACSAPSNATCTFISPLHNGLSARLVAAAAHPEAIAAAAAGPATAEKSASLSQSSRQTLLPQAATRCCRRNPVQHHRQAHNDGDNHAAYLSQNRALAGILLPMWCCVR